MSDRWPTIFGCNYRSLNGKCGTAPDRADAGADWQAACEEGNWHTLRRPTQNDFRPVTEQTPPIENAASRRPVERCDYENQREDVNPRAGAVYPTGGVRTSRIFGHTATEKWFGYLGKGYRFGQYSQVSESSTNLVRIRDSSRDRPN